jgi:hypothetical protein
LGPRADLKVGHYKSKKEQSAEQKNKKPTLPGLWHVGFENR